MNDEIWKRVDAVAAKLTELGQRLGPDVWDLTLAAMRVQALNQLLWLAVGLALIYVAWRCGWLIEPIIKQLNAAKTDEEGGYVAKLIVVVIAGGAGLIIGAVGTVTNLSAWPIMGLYDPRLLLAKRVLGL